MEKNGFESFIKTTPTNTQNDILDGNLQCSILILKKWNQPKDMYKVEVQIYHKGQKVVRW